MTHWWKNTVGVAPPLCSYPDTTERRNKNKNLSKKENFVLHQRNLKCAFSSSSELAGYQATVASLSSILIRALNNRIRTNLSIPIWYRCVSSWADDAGQAVTVFPDRYSSRCRPSGGYFRRSTVAEFSHGSRHPRHQLQLDQFAVVSVANVAIVRYGEQ